MVTCSLKLNCDGVDHTVKLDTKGKGKNVVTSLDDLVHHLAKTFNDSYFRLTYLDDDDHARRITEENDLFYAAEHAPRNVLHLKVTSHGARYERYYYHGENDFDQTDFLKHESSPVAKEKKQKNPKKKKQADFGVGKLATRFSIHYKECIRCAVSPYPGICHVYKLDSDYSLCDECLPYYDESDWRAMPFPWDRDVPAASLTSGNSYELDEVRHLQKVLTELEYMTPDQTDLYQGLFQVHTKNAVEAFRLEHKLYGDDMTVYDKQTERKLAEVVSKRKD